MDPMLFELVKAVGPTVAMVIYFIIRDAKREERMARRLDLLEDFQRGELLMIAKDSVTAIRENTKALERFHEAIKPPLHGKVAPSG